MKERVIPRRRRRAVATGTRLRPGTVTAIIVLLLAVVTPAAQGRCDIVVSATGSADPKNIDTLTGRLQYYSDISSSWVEDDYSYNDSWFSGDPTEINTDLALVSAQLAAAATDSTHGVSFLKEIGFDATAYDYRSTDADDCAYTYGTKAIDLGGESYTLIAVAPQGAGYGLKGWLQNVSVNSPVSDGTVSASKSVSDTSASEAIANRDHAAYLTAAKKIVASLQKLHPSGKSIIWLTGQSRGGAVANLVSALLNTTEAGNGIASGATLNISKIFTYTFETPGTTSNTSAHDERYKFIHNYVCDDDILTMVPIWGMMRYGQDHILNKGKAADKSAISDSLREINPAAYKYVSDYDPAALGGDVREYARTLVGKLEAAVPTRVDYTAIKAGAKYSYQDAFMILCKVMYKQNTAEESTDMMSTLMPLMGQMGDLISPGTGSYDTLFFSHQPDIIIARLKLAREASDRTEPSIKINGKNFKSGKTYKVKKGKSLLVKITNVNPDDKITIRSSNKKIAKVTTGKSGTKIKALKKARATVTIKINKFTIKINVKVT